MGEQVFETNGPVTVIIDWAQGDMQIMGWGENRVSVYTRDREPVEGQLDNGALRLSRVESDVRLRAPAGSSVEVHHCDGDLSVNNVGPLTVHSCAGDFEAQNVAELVLNEISGDVDIRNVGGVRGGRVRGDFEAHRVGALALTETSGDCEIHGSGAVQIDTVLGDMDAHEVGPVNIRQVHGDLDLGDVNGAVALETVRGDARIVNAMTVMIGAVNGDAGVERATGAVNLQRVNGDASVKGLAAGLAHRVHADGDVAIGLEPGPVKLTVRAHGAIRYDRALGLTVENETRRQLIARIGDGGAEIEVSAHGDAIVFGAGDERGRRGRGRWSVAGTHVPVPPVPPTPPIPPIPPMPPMRTFGGFEGLGFSVQTQRAAGPSADERASVLRMLAEGKINAEQAARLLDALGEK